MTKTIERTALFTKADEILQCVRKALAETEAGAPPRACVVPGAELLWDDCDCGLLAVTTLRAYPSDSFPVLKQTGPFNRCNAALTVVEYVVTVLRCVPMSDDNGHPPPCEDLTEASIRDLEDRWAVQRGVRCCLDGTMHLIQEQLAIGEQGRCAGSELHVFVALPNCEAC